MAGLTIGAVFKAFDQVSGPVKKMQGSVTGFGASAKGAFDGAGKALGTMKGLITGAVAAITTGAAAKALGDFASKGDEIAKTSRMLGMSTDALQELRYAAGMQGVETEALTASMKLLNNNLGQLQSGQGALYSRLKETNPALARQLRAVQSTDEAFMILMDTLKNETNVAKRAALAQAAFGRSGQELIKFADAGADGIAALRAEAHKYGLVIEQEAAENSEAFSDSLSRLQQSGKAIANGALAALVEKLQPLIQRMADWVAANKELIGQKIEQVIGGIESGVKLLSDGWNSGLIPAILAGVLAFNSINKAIAITKALMIALPALMSAGSTVMFAFQAVLGGAATAGEAFNMVLAANPIGLTVTAISLLIAGLVFLEVKFGAVSKAVGWVWDKMKAFGGWIKSTFGPIIDGIGKFMRGFSIGGSSTVNTENPMTAETDAWGVPVASGSMDRPQSTTPRNMGAFAGVPSAVANNREGISRAVSGSESAREFAKQYMAGNPASGLDQAAPVSPNTSVIESRSISESRSRLDVNFNNAPAGTSVKQTGEAPGIRVNLGPTGRYAQ